VTNNLVIARADQNLSSISPTVRSCTEPWPIHWRNGSRHAPAVSCYPRNPGMGGTAAVYRSAGRNAPLIENHTQRPARLEKAIESPNCLECFFDPVQTQMGGRNTVWRWSKRWRILASGTQTGRATRACVRRTGAVGISVKGIERWITRSRLVPKPSKQTRCNGFTQVHSDPSSRTPSDSLCQRDHSKPAAQKWLAQWAYERVVL